MTLEKRDKAYLMHILECTEMLPKHMSRLMHGKIWHEDETVRDALLRTLQIMSESCSKLSSDVKARAPEVDWKNIAGFRNVLAHDYLGDIDYMQVTAIIDRYVPQLQLSISRLYKELYDR